MTFREHRCVGRKAEELRLGVAIRSPRIRVPLSFIALGDTVIGLATVKTQPILPSSPLLHSGDVHVAYLHGLCRAVIERGNASTHGLQDCLMVDCALKLIMKIVMVLFFICHYQAESISLCHIFLIITITSGCASIMFDQCLLIAS